MSNSHRPKDGGSYELDEMQDEFETEAFLPSESYVPPLSQPRRGAAHLFKDFARSPYGAIFFVALAMFAALSIYFYVPSTLFIYLVSVCFVLPLYLAIDLIRLVHRRTLPTSAGAWARLVLGLIATLYALTCAVAVLRGDAYVAPRAPPVRVENGVYNPRNETFFIASNLYNNEAILPKYRSALLQFIVDMGPSNVFVSIFENDSQDRTPALLHELDAELERLGVQRHILTVTKRKGFRRLDRIERLAYLRNQAMDPMYVSHKDGLNGRPFSKVLFLNDILFDAATIHTLLDTAGGQFDQACAIDYYSIGFYDT